MFREWFAIRPSLRPLAWMAAVCAALLVGGLLGCQERGSDRMTGPDAGEPVRHTPAEAQVRLSFALDPRSEESIRSPTLRAAAATNPTVSVKMLSVQVGNASFPSVVTVATATADANHRVTLSVTVPAVPTVASVHVEGGTIGSYTDFRGALDLVPGNNVLTVHPTGFAAIQDVTAQLVEHIAMTPTRFVNATPDLVARVLAAVLVIDRSGEAATVYQRALDQANLLLTSARGAGTVAGSAVTDLITASTRGSTRAAIAAGARVYVESHPNITTTVATDGRFLLRNVPAGRVNLVVDDDKGIVGGLTQRYRGRSADVAVTANQTVTAPELRAQYAPNYIEGTVRDQVTNLPLPDVQVTVWGQVSTTDARGYYKVFNMPQGSHQVQFERIGYLTRSAMVSFGQGSSTTFDTTLTSTDITAPRATLGLVVNVSATTATVQWTTNEPCTSQVEYGTTGNYGHQTNPTQALTREHAVTITGLIEGTTYQYRAVSRDSAGNVARTANASFTTTSNADVTAPVISGIRAVNPTETSVTIEWTTHEPANAQIEYGSSTAYGQATVLTADYTLNHSLLVTGLTAGTTYHYRIRSADGANNLALSADLTFTTAADTVPPIISAVQTDGIGPDRVTIVWVTDEPATTQVEHGPTLSYDRETTLDPSLVRNHSATLTGLTPGTTWHFRGKSRDAAGNLAQTSDQVVTTATVADSTPPTISGARVVNIGENSATVIWTTNEPANSRVEYGRSTDYDMLTALDPAMVTDHTVAIGGLMSGTTYHCRIITKDAAGNQALTEDLAFTTADLRAPLISSVQVTDVTPAGATIL